MKNETLKMKRMVWMFVLLGSILSSSFCVAFSGVYAYVDVRGESDRKAKVRPYYSISGTSGGYYVRLIKNGRQIKVNSSHFRGAVSYAMTGMSNVSSLTKKRDEMMRFRTKFTASSRYLTPKISELSRRIARYKEAYIERLVLKNGKVYNNVRILSKKETGAEVQVGYSVFIIPFEQLPDSLVKKFGGYDKDKAKARTDKKARALVLKKASSGDVDSQYELANTYFYGKGCELDKQKAIEWYEKAAQNGHEKSALLTGLIYWQKEDLKSQKRSVAWLQKSAKKNNPQALTSLGIVYLLGKGVEKDAELACKHLRKAGGLGDAQADYLLGMCYFSGNGVNENRVKAKDLIAKARKAKVPGADRFWVTYNLDSD